MIFLRYNQKRPGANAILVAIATGAVATSWIPGALAGDTGPIGGPDPDRCIPGMDL